MTRAASKTHKAGGFAHARRARVTKFWTGLSTRGKVGTVIAGATFLLLVALLAFGLGTGERHIKEAVARSYSISDAQFPRTMGSLLGRGVTSGNQVEALENGDAIFPAMLQAIRSAQKSITFETYIYWSGDVGREFAKALSERALAGVKVFVLIDWVGGNKMDHDTLDLLKKAGVELQQYHPLRWYSFQRLNNRTHRKLLVVDGRVGFTGGVGIADQWNGHGQDPDHWRDAHFKAQGPVVAQMQASFLDNWTKVTGKVVHDGDFFPELAVVGTQDAQMFSSSPSGGSESMKMMYLLAITAAEHSIQLSSAYFVPDELARDALIAAVKRGVKVQIIMPGEHMDSETVRRASRSGWGELLEAGVEIYEYQPTMYHCKVMVADGLFVSVGSTNFDARSFGLNDEANLNIYNRDFAAAQIKVFEQDLARSKLISLEAWKNRPLHRKMQEYLASFLAAML